MIASARVIRRLAAAASVVGLGAGLMTAAMGSAQAAVPDQWGFAYVSKPAVAGVPDLMHQAGSWPAAFHVHTAPAAVGAVIVMFPRIASKNGVVHVTAVNEGPVWCQAEKWAASGPNELVSVRCHKVGGAPVFSPFTVLWKVRLPGLGSSGWAGNVQVTAVNPAVAAKCQIAAWTPATSAQQFLVRCFNGAATPLKTGWTLSYQRGRSIFGGQPKLFAYIFNDKPANPGPYVPAPPAVSFNSASGANTVTNGGGFSLVHFPRVGALPNTVLVSPFRAGAGFCNLNTLWSTAPAAPGVIVRDVVCWDATGHRKPAASFVTYTSAH